MSSATYPPRCPHRVAILSTNRWLSLLIVSLLGSTTATVSLHGQDLVREIDYRLVDPASHMQPWPDNEPEVPPLTMPTRTLRIAAKWRTNLTPPREEKKTTAKQEASGTKQLLGPTTTNSVDKPESDAEVLIVPTPATKTPPRTAAKPAAKSRDCYQAPPLSALSTSIAMPGGKLPTNAAVQCAMHNPPTSDLRLVGAWAGTEHHWSATCSRHRPLYFEEINAERYGYTPSYALQPVISAARFFATIPALPYKMVLERPCDCIYTLGHYRPGSCAPRRCNRLPWKLNASAVETGFIAGMILLIP